jgi:hypothetical protein
MVPPYPRQKPLLVALACSAALFWSGLALLLVTAFERYLPDLGPEYPLALAGGTIILIYTLRHIRAARRVAYLQGHAVEIGPKQHPDLHARLKNCCKRLGLETPPTAYLFQNPRHGHSFGLHFLGRDFLALNGDLIGAFTDHQGAIDFFIGSELGRLQDRSRPFLPLLFPALVLPLLGPAYARARTYTCDRYGLEACKAKADAALALALLTSGSRRWKSLNVMQFAQQGAATGGFLMSLMELVSTTPYLSKRIAHLRAIATQGDSFIPRRHPLAYAAALFLPYLAPRSPGGARRLLVALFWPVVLALGGDLGYQQLARSGVLELVESRFEDKAAPPAPAAPSPAPPPATEPAPPKTAPDAYAPVDTDLKLLGNIALARSKKHGGIPCEVGNVAALKLNLLPGRYAYSCDEPVVYTAIEAGEFEAGKGPHLRTYNWKEGRIVPTPVREPPSPEPQPEE